MSQERTRFPITPEERHRTARSFDDVQAVPEENLPLQEDQPQDKPLPPTAEAADDADEASDDAEDTDEARDDADADDTGGDQDDVARSSRDTGGDAPAAASIDEREAVATDSDDLMEDDGGD